ncbi:MAG TPA: sulfotransferase [Acetobacteraceae bacterium]|jgi:hypothetical protein
MADHAPFFIIGAGRSGTTLLRLILTGHSRLHIPPETWFLQPLVRELPLRGVLTLAQRQRAIEIMVRHERWDDLGVGEEEFRRLADVLEQPALVDLIDIVYRRLLSLSAKVRVGDKTPHYFAIVPELAMLYPTAKFIHLIRDGHDVAISWIDAGWERYYEPGFEWPRAMACLGHHPDSVLTVRYEDLMRQPETTVRRICAFLGEIFEPGMLDWQDRAELVAPRDRHLHARLPQPLSETSVAVWRRRLSAMECFAMEACLYQGLLAAGYPLRFAARGWRPLFKATARTLRGCAPILRRGVPKLQKWGVLPRDVYL